MPFWRAARQPICLMKSRWRQRIARKSPMPAPLGALQGRSLSRALVYARAITYPILGQGWAFYRLFGGLDLAKPIITTCGSGITAVLRGDSIYDSWAEWGDPDP